MCGSILTGVSSILSGTRPTCSAPCQAVSAHGLPHTPQHRHQQPPLPARVATLDDGSPHGRNDIRLGVAANGAGPRTAFAEDMNILVSADGELFATYPDGHECSGQAERLLPGQRAKVCATAGVLICDADDNIIYRGGPPWEITVLSGSSHYVTWDGDGNIIVREVDHLPIPHLGLCDTSDSDMSGSSSDDY